MSNTVHFADRLAAAVAAKGSPVCVGIDPVLERLPEAFAGQDPLGAIGVWSRGVLEAVKPSTPVVKFQSACFERYGSAGVGVLEQAMTRARELGLLIILDAKRGDIGISSAHYAHAVFEFADALTISPYLGLDAIDPFIDHAAKVGGGLFALVRTSNPGSDALQGQRLQSGLTIAEHVAGMIQQAGTAHLGQGGYSLLGAVVGATKRTDIQSLRTKMGEQWFLLPGYGAQGGGADDVKAAFNTDGQGALVTASRSVIYAPATADSPDWQAAVAAAAAKLAAEIAQIRG